MRPNVGMEASLLASVDSTNGTYLSLTPLAISRLASCRGLMKTQVSLGVPFSSSRFVTIGSISDAVDDDGIEQLFVETLRGTWRRG